MSNKIVEEKLKDFSKAIDRLEADKRELVGALRTVLEAAEFPNSASWWVAEDARIILAKHKEKE